MDMEQTSGQVSSSPSASFHGLATQGTEHLIRNNEVAPDEETPPLVESVDEDVRERSERPMRARMRARADEHAIFKNKSKQGRHYPAQTMQNARGRWDRQIKRQPYAYALGAAAVGFAIARFLV